MEGEASDDIHRGLDEQAKVLGGRSSVDKVAVVFTSLLSGQYDQMIR